MNSFTALSTSASSATTKVGDLAVGVFEIHGSLNTLIRY